MRARSFCRTVSVDVDVDIRFSDLVEALDRDDVIELAKSKGLVVVDPEGKSRSDTQDLQDVIALAESKGLVVLRSEGLEEAADRLRWHDLPGTFLALDRLMPARFRNFSDDLARLAGALPS